jgi:hypothetical protein
MRDYSKTSSRFWSGSTGRQLRGDADGQRVAFYLFTCPSANMIGLYYIALPTLIHEIGISEEGASKALRRVCQLDFAHYDVATEYVWVKNMAFEQIGPTLDPRDKRHLGVLRELENHRKSPYFNQFLDLYSGPFHLENVRREGSPFEAPCKPHRSKEKEKEQDKEKEYIGSARKTRAPGEMEISPAMRQWATDNGITVNLDAETAAMLDHHRGKGNLHSDWNATWRTWMRRSKTYGASHGTQSIQQNYETRGEALIRKQQEAGKRARELLLGAAGDGTGPDDPPGKDRALRARAGGSE